jgi:hypothetical protein
MLLSNSPFLTKGTKPVQRNSRAGGILLFRSLCRFQAVLGAEDRVKAELGNISTFCGDE